MTSPDPFTADERAALVAEARRWLGTRYKHQGRLKGVGVDCVGLAIGVAQARGLQWTDRMGYARVPAGGHLLAALESVTDAIDPADALTGDLLLFAWERGPQHVGIVSSLAPRRIVHAWAKARRCVENDVDAMWQSRLVGARRLRKIGAA